MENTGEGVDDQSSGWLEVKKKHRSSSKFSLQGWVSGFSGKNIPKYHQGQSSINRKSGNFHGKRTSNHQKTPVNFASGSPGNVADAASVSEVDEKGVRYQDKCVVNLENKCSNSAVAAVMVTDSVGSSGDVQETSHDDKRGIVHKIKWGDLDNDLLLNPEMSVKAEINHVDVSSNNLVASKSSETIEDLPSCDSSCTKRQENIEVEIPGDADVSSPPMLSSYLINESCEEDSQKLNQIHSGDIEVLVPLDTMVDQKEVVFNCKDKNHEHLSDDVLGPTAEDTELRHQTSDIPAVLDPKVSDGNGICIQTASSRDSDSKLLCEEGTRGALEESSITCTAGECNGGLDGQHNYTSKGQKMSDLGNGDTGESKERFRQRLWCFLFENLNRAVDELYLLCELECDMEQMKEAILVLEEASSDFQELTTRVQEFENVKKSSPRLMDDLPVTSKSDHRRPHALSWEVRRMTTSQHRAEILSSSLEAFKKIQQEISNTHPALGPVFSHFRNSFGNSAIASDLSSSTMNPLLSKEQRGGINDTKGSLSGEKRRSETGKSTKLNLVHVRGPSEKPSTSASIASRPGFLIGKGNVEPPKSSHESENLVSKNNSELAHSISEGNSNLMDHSKRQIPQSEKDKDKRNSSSWKRMDAWKEKRNWEDILSSPFRVSSRVSHSPGMSRKSTERSRTLHDKLMSPDKKKKTALDLKKEAEEKHARALRIRNELENERVQKLQRTSEKLNRVNELQAVRSSKLRELMSARHQRSVSRHEAYLAEVVRRAGDESSKVNEVRFITSLNEENKKLMLRQKLHDSELRRAEKLQVIKSKQREDMAREEAVSERRKLIEAEKLQRLAETQRKKEEAQIRREEERKASSAAREAKAIEQLRKKESRAKSQQEEAELLAQKLAERLYESEQRRKFYLEQIRERASMDFRDQSSPLLRRSLNKDNQGRTTPTNSSEDNQTRTTFVSGSSTLTTGKITVQHSLKRRIKRIRQRLMALKYEFPEPFLGNENSGVGYRTAVGTARAKIGRWLQELQRHRQARKEGAASIGLITAEVTKFLDGRDPELHASRQAGLLDFIASALPASHTSKPEACLVTVYLLRLLRVALSLPANKNYFLAQNLLPPIIPMLAAALENYIKIAASISLPGNASLLSSEPATDNYEYTREILDGFLWTVTVIVGSASSDDRQLQMQDGLLELVTAYQVIHRLRDLFALYDRPQVEGSPFPSSILLSIKLLITLTSRSRTISSIDWESFPSETLSGKDDEADSSESVHFSLTSVSTSNERHRPPLSKANDSTVAVLPDVPEDRPLDILNVINGSKKQGFGNNDPGEQTDIFVVSDKIDTDLTAAKEEPNTNVDISKKGEPQKDESFSISVDKEKKNEKAVGVKQTVAFLLSVISDTGLVSLPSLLTAVLLRANNRVSSEQASYILPSNFEEVATGVLKVLNNLALLDISFLQKILARPDLKMEIFHLMSFLLSHCTSKWKVANDQVGFLLVESLSLLGYFALFHPGNQAVLRWGKSPTILHKVCDLPFVFFSDPDVMPVLAGTLVAACYGSEQNKNVVQQELNVDMLLTLLRSCKNGSPDGANNLARIDKFSANDSCDSSNSGPEYRKVQVENVLRSVRHNGRNARIILGKNNSQGNTTRIGKIRSQKDCKVTKLVEDSSMKPKPLPSESCTPVMLHSRFPDTFVERVELFFSTDT